tara:strand:- start:384 stop:1466 length:1083 start_codon:yes stop_codon:yes gene_type:complete
MENNEKLENFSWDSWDNAENVSEPVEEKKEVKAEVKPETPEVKEKPKEEAEEEIKEEAAPEISFEEETFDSVDGEEGEEVSDTQTLMNKLKDEGVLTFEFEEDQEISDVIDNEIESRVEETMEGFFDELDEDAIAFLKYKKNGGDTKKFFESLKSATDNPAGDINNENYQENLIKYGLQQEGYDAEDIEDKLEWLKEGGKLKRHAEKYEEKFEKQRGDYQKKMVEEQKDRDNTAREQREQLSQDLKQRLNDTESIGHFSFNRDDKRNLHTYMTKVKVKAGKNNYLTQMQNDLQKAFQDPEKILVIAKLLRNDFDISDVIRNTETKITKKTKDKIERKPTIKSSKSSSGRKKKALHEYFND